MRAPALVFSLILAAPGLASAHISLVEPPSRYGRDVLKFGPCGMSGDSPRSDNVTVLEPGAELTVRFEEYIDHPSHYRIAFDDDGIDDFVDPACTAGCDTTSPTIERYSNETVLLDGIEDGASSRTVTVTLPDVECERCTLQLIQVMYDKPPYETPGNDIYYQCADLVLRSAGGDAGVTDAGARDAGTGGDASGGAPDAGGGSAGSGGGCAAGGPAPAGGAGPLAILAALGLLARRRR